MQQRAGFEAVQLELAECERAERGDGGGGDAAAAALAGHPVADVRALERAADEVGERDLAGELAALEDQEAERRAGRAVALDLGQAGALPAPREERRLAARVPRSEVLPLRGQQGRDVAGVRAHGWADRHLPVQHQCQRSPSCAHRPSTITAVSVARRTALFSLGAALALVAVKLVVGFATGSLGILAEAVHSGVDAGAALLTVWALGVADRPADPQHPYGHGKAQNLSALGEAAILVLAAAWIALSAIFRLGGDGGEVRATWYAVALLTFVLLVDAARATASARAARSEGSAALGANAVHFAVDFAGTLAVMAGLGLTALGHPRADAIAALFVAVLVVFGAARLAGSNVNALMDSAPAGAEANLRAVVASLPA